MSFRSFVEKIGERGGFVKPKRALERKFEAAGLLKALDGKPVLVEIKGSQVRVAGNVFSTKQLVAEYLCCKPEELTKKMLNAIGNPRDYQVVENAACFEVVENEVDLHKLPILTHCEKDGGPYIASGVIFARDAALGLNASFHRGMIASKDEIVLRILPRHLDSFLKRNGSLDVAYAIGNGANVLLAAATSTEEGVDEMRIASALEPLEMAACANGTLVPAESEFVLEGTITPEMRDEGPFVDLTGTYDDVRKQRVFKVKRVTHRKNPVYHALVPGGLEHKVMMGMPREPTILKKVNEACECVDVSITPGGCSWLHGVVKIRKKSEEDGRKAIEAAFKGHASMKHVVIVDEDIDILDPLDVEWAISTRVQMDKDAVIKPGEKGSSLDPSADPETRATCKVGLDATCPLEEKKFYLRAEFPKVNLKELV